jgi:hypothetical protein
VLFLLVLIEAIVSMTQARLPDRKEPEP